MYMPIYYIYIYTFIYVYTYIYIYVYIYIEYIQMRKYDDFYMYRFSYCGSSQYFFIVESNIKGFIMRIARISQSVNESRL